jgi:hypothetical protein
MKIEKNKINNDCYFSRLNYDVRIIYTLSVLKCIKKMSIKIDVFNVKFRL